MYILINKWKYKYWGRKKFKYKNTLLLYGGLEGKVVKRRITAREDGVILCIL